MNLLPFKISSALKNLIGKELITDEFVAVYELVKNSFDAYAKNVEIIFENGRKPSEAKITIKDDGKGMDIHDIENKWLFVAYSAKKEGIENNDYRDKIKSNRVFAGAKGVGRFSCDRIGSKLNLFSKKDNARAKIEHVIIDWSQFEKSALTEFFEIKIQQETVLQSPLNLRHGTILEISGLRDQWDRNRILTLKRSLVKLINPNQENDSRNFKIRIIAPHELAQDKKAKETYNKVNGNIDNTLFEQLKIKTTNIAVEISEEGDTIKTVLEDRGDFIYELVERNPFSKNLKNIKVYLFQLNQSAKMSFHKIMGMRSIDYGAVFMYKNGFRIYPFGEPGEDILLIDRRKGQGYSRFLGNRDLIGRIEIYGDNSELRETTSRDGGVVKTDTYYILTDFFYDYVLKRLESYVVNVIKWGDEFLDKATGEMKSGLGAKDVKVEIMSLITGLIKSENVIRINYNEDFLNIIEKKSDDSIDKVIKNITRVANNTDNTQLLKEAKKISKVFKEIKEDTKVAEKRLDEVEAKRKEAEEKLEQEIRQSLFHKSIIGREKQDLISLQHQIRHTTSSISWTIDKLIEAVKADIEPEKIIEYINKISFEISKISSAANVVTKANFNMQAAKISGDIVAFINDYVENVYKSIDHYIHENKSINIKIERKKTLELKSKFRPLELTVVMDNLFTNAKKAGARNVILNWKDRKDTVELRFQDDGRGISDKIVERVFDFGFSNTDGSGIGLYHVRQTMENFGGSISINNKLEKGVEFILKFIK